MKSTGIPLICQEIQGQKISVLCCGKKYLIKGYGRHVYNYDTSVFSPFVHPNIYALRITMAKLRMMGKSDILLVLGITVRKQDLSDHSNKGICNIFLISDFNCTVMQVSVSSNRNFLSNFIFWKCRNRKINVSLENQKNQPTKCQKSEKGHQFANGM